MQKFIEMFLEELDHQAGSNTELGLTVTAIKLILKDVAEKYNDGWILCSEQMPVERQSVFAKFKGTLKWTDAMFETISKDVFVTVVYDNGEADTRTMHTTDGKWHYDPMLPHNFEVIAWKPFPEHMKPEGFYNRRPADE